MENTEYDSFGTRPEAESKPFNLKLVSAMSGERLYRVYFRDNDFYFIRMAGLRMSQAVTVHFGLIGLMLRSTLKKREDQKLATLIQTMDLSHPAQRLADHKHNFKLNPLDFQESQIDPPAFFTMYGPALGRWIVRLRDGKKMVFQFENVVDMKTALETLPRSLASTLTINVEWIEKKKKFGKRTA